MSIYYYITFITYMVNVKVFLYVLYLSNGMECTQLLMTIRNTAKNRLIRAAGAPYIITCSGATVTSWWTPKGRFIYLYRVAHYSLIQCSKLERHNLLPRICYHSNEFTHVHSHSNHLFNIVARFVTLATNPHQVLCVYVAMEASTCHYVNKWNYFQVAVKKTWAILYIYKRIVFKNRPNNYIIHYNIWSSSWNVLETLSKIV